MPLMKSRSKKAFEHNVKAEMHAGKPQDQSLAIAYSVKRKAKKKASGGTVESGSKDMNMAEGGEISAKTEKRPMPDNTYNDSAMKSRNSGDKPASHDGWTDNITVNQAQKPSPAKPSRPPLKGSDAFSVRYRDEIEEDNHRMTSMPPESDKAQPPQRDNEDGPNRQGPQVRDMQDEHSTHRKPYAKGGEIEPGDEDSHNINIHTDMEPDDDTMSDRERMEEQHLMYMADPSVYEGASDARSRNEEGPNRQGPAISDMEDEHSTGRKPYAKGGTIQYRDAMDYDHDEDMNPAHDKYSPDDSEDQPGDEEREERHNSIAAAIMAKKHRGSQDSDSDMDRITSMAEGGEITEPRGTIKSHGSMDTTDDDQSDLSRNADEDANEEDQQSFHALEKENYSESEGLRQLDNPRDSGQTSDEEEMDSHDKHDMIQSIMRKMSARKQFRSK